MVGVNKQRTEPERATIMNKVSLSQQFKKEAADYVTNTRALNSWLKQPNVVKILASLDYLSEKYNASVFSHMSSDGLRIYMTVKDLNGLKDESLDSFLYSMEHLNAKRQSSYDDASSYSRMFVYTWEETHNGVYVTLLVNIAANFKSDSDTCKRVIIGYIEPPKEAQPIYKLECVEVAYDVGGALRGETQ